MDKIVDYFGSELNVGDKVACIRDGFIATFENLEVVGFNDEKVKLKRVYMENEFITENYGSFMIKIPSEVAQ